MPRRWLLTMVALVGVTLIALQPGLHPDESTEIKPQLFTLTTGSARRVADGRAQLWLGAVDLEHSVAGAGVTPAARVELHCLGETYTTWATEDRPGDEVCGCRVRLVEALDTSPPSAIIEVTWDPGYKPPIQAASQSAAAGRKGSSTRRR